MYKPYVQTYTAVVGNAKCNAKCPYCISKMTPCHEESSNLNVNWRNFKKGAELAKQWGASTFLITGKGEPTLYPDLVLEFIKMANELGYSIIELQTNAINLSQLDNDGWLDRWYQSGLTTISISAVHYDNEFNKKIISENYPDLKDSLNILKKNGRDFCVRLSIIMIKDGIDGFKKASLMIQKANELKVDQLKLFPVNSPIETDNKKMKKWVKTHSVDPDFLIGFKKLLDAKCKVLRRLVHGDTVYSWKDNTMNKDQNVCFGSCLTESESENDIRQLIYCRDGHIRYSWQYKSSILF